MPACRSGAPKPSGDEERTARLEETLTTEGKTRSTTSAMFTPWARASAGEGNATGRGALGDADGSGAATARAGASEDRAQESAAIEPSTTAARESERWRSCMLADNRRVGGGIPAFQLSRLAPGSCAA